MNTLMSASMKKKNKKMSKLHIFHHGTTTKMNWSVNMLKTIWEVQQIGQIFSQKESFLNKAMKKKMSPKSVKMRQEAAN